MPRASRANSVVAIEREDCGRAWLSPPRPRRRGGRESEFQDGRRILAREVAAVVPS